MRYKDLITGTKKRKNRYSRNHRIIQKDLYNADPKKLGEAVKGREINHIEDFAIFYGSKGAQDAVNKIKSLVSNPQDTTIKWDGSPAVVFGRNENGEFIFTDKHGFSAKKYDGRVKTSKDLEQMFLSRKIEPGKEEDRKNFAAKMASIWPKFENAVPENFRGYVHGDILYFSTPNVEDGRYVFTPNTTTYSVDSKSDIGKRIGASNVGVVLHQYIDLDDNKGGKVNVDDFNVGELLVMPPVSISHSPELDTPTLDKISQEIKSSGAVIDNMLNVPAELKMSDFDNILYAYINGQTKAGKLDSLGDLKDFAQWVSTSNLSGAKQQRVVDYVTQNSQGFTKLFGIVNGLMSVKNKVINYLDSQTADIEAYTAGQRGGEGYVIGKDAKLVNRGGFTQANMNRER